MELLNGEEDEITTTETSIRFDIKVVQNGSVVNTISLIGENSIIDSDTLIKKRVFRMLSLLTLSIYIKRCT